MSHPYEVLGGGVGGNVHNPAHFVARPELLILNPPEALCFATIRNPTSPARTHRVFYARLFGGQCRERTAAEKLSCVHEQARSNCSLCKAWAARTRSSWWVLCVRVEPHAHAFWEAWN